METTREHPFDAPAAGASGPGPAPRLDEVLALLDVAVVLIGADGRVLSANEGALALLGRSAEEVEGVPYPLLIDLGQAGEAGGSDPEPLVGRQREAWLLSASGERVPILLSGARTEVGPERREVVACVGTDLSERRRLEMELRLAQKLESVGQLASGIAHEINTPLQFVGDSVHFLEDAFAGFQVALAGYRKLADDGPAGAERAAALLALRACEAEHDLPFLEQQTPAAIARAIEGIRRVMAIVGAMKRFAHSSDSDKEPSDINDAIETTLIVARNEYKYVAEIEKDLAELPPVVCNIGDVNQVLLNLIVNAAHAIQDAGGEPEARGRITVRTRSEPGRVVITVADTGCGIPPEARERLFDPFFTTKEVGRGTGQGLPISRNIVVEKHGGQLWFDSTPGRGTSFHVALPVEVEPIE